MDVQKRKPMNGLKALMVSRNVSANELSEALDIGLNTLYNKLSGNNSFTLDEVIRIIDYFKIPENEFGKVFPIFGQAEKVV